MASDRCHEAKPRRSGLLRHEQKLSQQSAHPDQAATGTAARCVVINTQCVLEPCMSRPGINTRRESQLCHMRKPLKLRRIHDRANSRCERNVLLDGNPNHAHRMAGLRQLRNISIGMAHPCILNCSKRADKRAGQMPFKIGLRQNIMTCGAFSSLGLK